MVTLTNSEWTTWTCTRNSPTSATSSAIRLEHWHKMSWISRKWQLWKILIREPYWSKLLKVTRVKCLSSSTSTSMMQTLKGSISVSHFVTIALCLTLMTKKTRKTNFITKDSPWMNYAYLMWPKTLAFLINLLNEQATVSRLKRRESVKSTVFLRHSNSHLTGNARALWLEPLMAQSLSMWRAQKLRSKQCLAQDKRFSSRTSKTMKSNSPYKACALFTLATSNFHCPLIYQRLVSNGILLRLKMLSVTSRCLEQLGLKICFKRTWQGAFKTSAKQVSKSGCLLETRA